MPNIFPIYKPKGPTSNDMLTKIKRMTHTTKVGHAGTLDPLASGVLVVGIGRDATRSLGEEVKKEKEYYATIRLGISSTTDDEEGEKTEYPIKGTPPEEVVKQVLRSFLGIIDQVPPVYSAIKVSGKEAYKRVRGGEKITLPARRVEIRNIELIAYAWPLLTIRVTTGPGVYIRSLARDIGGSLQTGGYLVSLERTRVGQFKKEDCVPLELISELLTKNA